eukprot:4062099-Prymnesium_polylepis.1
MLCRVCFGGPEAGKLFSPCLCRGSMRFVHVHCLNEWRATSQNPRSFFRCDQCRYEYRVQRTALASVLQSEAAVLVASAVLLLATVALGALLPFHPERQL